LKGIYLHFGKLHHLDVHFIVDLAIGVDMICFNISCVDLQWQVFNFPIRFQIRVLITKTVGLRRNYRNFTLTLNSVCTSGHERQTKHTNIFTQTIIINLLKYNHVKEVAVS